MHFQFKKYYKSLFIGMIITAGFAIFLNLGEGNNFFLIQPERVSYPLYIVINTLGFLISGLFASFLVYQASNRQLGILLSILISASVFERYLDIQDNLITIPLIILFWLGIVYLIVPKFFKKYKVAILTVYGLAISFYIFLFFRTVSDFSVSNRSDFVNFILVPIPVFFALWVFEHWRWLKTLKENKEKAELSLLKSQINPHFFFNTLNNLYGLVIEKSPQAPEVILKLSDMMRYTIYEGKEDFVKLSDEINYLESYIELHKIRYQKKVDIKFTHQVESDIHIAPLLFIILLENAFKHGVEKLTEGAYIHAHLTTKNDVLTFSIENNYEIDTFKEKEGIGIDNLQRRLRHLYPNSHELNIEKTDHIYKVQMKLLLNSESRL